jgi:hypothetical protein
VSVGDEVLVDSTDGVEVSERFATESAATAPSTTAATIAWRQRTNHGSSEGGKVSSATATSRYQRDSPALRRLHGLPSFS